MGTDLVNDTRFAFRDECRNEKITYEIFDGDTLELLGRYLEIVDLKRP